MEYFFETTETVPKGLGFSHYDGTHITWLCLLAVAIILNAILYRKLSESGRDKWRKITAILLIADEIFKVVMLLIGGRYIPKYLPLHLCSINIFIIAAHAWRPKTKALNNFLYAICIPSSLLALAFPTWTKLPFENFMHIHSFTVHILLALYPIVLLLNGELKPKLRDLPKTLCLLLGFAVIALAANLIFDTNFMFLSSASKGNPLYWFKVNWGDHRYGFPVLISAILFLFYAPIVIRDAIKNRKKKATNHAK